ncbi:MAG: hypothetical protein MUD10_05675, partial [Candidatus Pacebacteria bacterium]|nr:hypothetical protein [Candidatus Paceibacterota bacterium]
MKKKTLVACYTIVSLFTWVVSPAAAVFASNGDDNENGDNGTTTVVASVNTTLTANVGNGENAEPIIKAKWEMDGPYASMTGTDEDDDSGAQFDPSGQYQVDKEISLCAIATDPDGLSDIDSVYGDLYYPNIKIHQDPQEPGREGCGRMVGTECRMRKLTKANGLSLFCDNIRNNNTNLPAFGVGYDYNEICKADGELQKETAAVYCCDKTLSYEDPAGEYKVIDFAQDKFGLSSEPLENTFDYEPVTSF